MKHEGAGSETYKKPNYIALGMVLWLSIGALAGILLFDNVATGAAMGISLGICFGAAAESI